MSIAEACQPVNFTLMVLANIQVKMENTVAPLVLGFTIVVEEMGTVWLLMSEVGPTDCLQFFSLF